jgi:uncharacterized protein YjbI with pentapeptide repeats
MDLDLERIAFGSVVGLCGASLYAANLIGANLSGARLIGTDLTLAHLTGAHLNGADRMPTSPAAASLAYPHGT